MANWLFGAKQHYEAFDNQHGIPSGLLGGLPDERTLEAMQAKYKDLGAAAKMGTLSNLAGVLKDKVDLSALQSAGFGATGLQLDQYKREGYKALFGLSGGVRTKMLLALREVVKEAMLSDPDMWRCVRRRFETSIENVWADIILFEEQMVSDVQNSLTERVASDHAGLSALGKQPLLFSPFWFRAKLLYCMLPFDKSIFGQVKDPLFWVLMAVSMVPQFGIRIIFWLVVLLCIVRGCPPDEYQLVSFILGFKGTQVLSSGVIMSVISSVKYYMCVHPNEYHNCATAGPGVEDYLSVSGVDFVGSSVLVWLAFLLLPLSKPSAGLRGVEEDDEKVRALGSSDEESARTCCRRRRRTSCCSWWDPSRGGRLAGLLCWDLLSFALSILLFFCLLFVDEAHLRPDGQPAVTEGHNVESWSDVKRLWDEDVDTWNIRVAVFFTRAFYAWLSFPFLVFKLPVINSILTHTSPTGYNRQGFCVPFLLRPMPPKEE